MAMINLPYGNAAFPIRALVKHVKSTGRGYIIQGQVQCTLENHPKPNSLDVWLRENYAKHPDRKQAVNAVIDDIVATGYFAANHSLVCPDSGRNCKGIELTEKGKNSCKET